MAKRKTKPDGFIDPHIRFDNIEYFDPNKLRPTLDNPRDHSHSREALRASIEAYGWTTPIILHRPRRKKDGQVAKNSPLQIIAGHNRHQVALEFMADGLLSEVPCVFIDDLTEAQARAYLLDDNQVADLSEWSPMELSEFVKTLDEFEVAPVAWSPDELDHIRNNYVTVGEHQRKTGTITGKEFEVPEMGERCSLIYGDCLEKMRDMPDDSVHAVVTDPPYELGFMGKEWDADGAAHSIEIWQEALRVALPGAYLVAFSAPRTEHRMICAIEDAGWQIRDKFMWLYGQGFPKSHDLSKGIDAMAGAEREVIGTNPNVLRSQKHKSNNYEVNTGSADITAPATPAAKHWSGWGTALKPAWEPIVLARKPLSEETVAENALKHATGALNIDACRVEGEERPLLDARVQKTPSSFGDMGGSKAVGTTTEGRCPPNCLIDEAVAEMIGDEQRFFYCAKTNPTERNAGLEHLPDQDYKMNAPPKGDTKGKLDAGINQLVNKNNHPTVKPLNLMLWLTRLVTPPNGTVLDPFMGSGTTGMACVEQGFAFIGIEQDVNYMEIAHGRITRGIK